MRDYRLRTRRHRTFAQQRESAEVGVARIPPPSDVAYTPVTVGEMPAQWVAAPGASAACAILYLHGGAYALGSLNTHRPLVTALARAARVRVLALDYRLALEHPFPAALDDSLAAYCGLLADGIDPARLALVGDSAGGGHAVAFLVALRDTGDPLPAACVCLSPWVDLALAGESLQTKAKRDVMVTPDLLHRSAAAYLAGAEPRTPLASPLDADLFGLPPLLIQVGTDDVLLDDAVRLAVLARAAGCRSR